MDIKYKGITTSASEEFIQELKEKYNIDFEKEMKEVIDTMILDIKEGVIN